MRGLSLGLAVAMLASAAFAGGWSGTWSLAGGSVGVTNSQANSSWAPVAVLWKFNTATNAVVTVDRESQGNSYRLGAASVSNASSVVWVPDAAYPFSTGDVLRVGSSVTNGQVEVIRKGE